MSYTYTIEPRKLRKRIPYRSYNKRFLEAFVGEVFFFDNNYRFPEEMIINEEIFINELQAHTMKIHQLLTDSFNSSKLARELITIDKSINILARNGRHFFKKLISKMKKHRFKRAFLLSIREYNRENRNKFDERFPDEPIEAHLNFIQQMMKRSILMVLAETIDKDVVIAVDFFDEGCIVDINHHIVSWVFTNETYVKTHKSYIFDCMINYGVNLIGDLTLSHKTRTIGYSKDRDKIYIDPTEVEITRINKEILQRNEKRARSIRFGTKKVRFSPIFTTLNQMKTLNHKQYGFTAIVMLEYFLHKWHLDKDIFDKITLELDKLKYRKIVFVVPHLRQEFIKWSIAIDDPEGFSEDMIHQNHDLYLRIKEALSNLHRKTIYITIPFVSDTFKFTLFKERFENILSRRDVKPCKYGIMVQTDSMSTHIKDIRRINSVDFAYYDLNLLYEETLEFSRFEYVSYPSHKIELYPTLRDYKNDLDERFYEQYVSGYLMFNPVIAEKMFNSGFFNIGLYNKQMDNFMIHLERFNTAYKKPNKKA